MNVGDTATLTATVCPCNATNTTLVWSSSDPDIVSVDADTGQISALDAGEVIITAMSIDGDYDAHCIINIISLDPFHHTNIEFVRIKKWQSTKTTNGIIHTNCDMFTVATQSCIDNLSYITVLFPDEDEITTFEINDALINQLNALEREYTSQFIKQGRPFGFHKGKQFADIFVEEGKISLGSIEYYGIWAYNGNAVCEIYDRLSLTFAIASIAYSGFMYGFTKVVSMQASQMAVGQTKTYNHSQYKNAV